MTGRHDPCICPRVVPVVESMIAVVIADHLLRQLLVRPSISLPGLRREIDLVDDALLMLLNERQSLVKLVGTMKKRAGTTIDDRPRENAILSRLLDLSDGTILDERLVRSVYAEIFRHAKGIQKR